ncbi:MAG: thiopurine S-methyltransferase [Gammaproteobacteria bacterium]|jgi:thiopurine S-methyltransferase|nr:thiopurine S-methyltransferase [Gammaproteobacteria bacterium]
MEQQFWQEKWNANEIGFHQDSVHPLLEKHFASLGLEKGDRVFVPLCGKSSDIICLQKMGYEVVGLELSEVAAQSFFSENNLYASINDAGEYKRFQSAHIEILCGDFFSVTKEILGNISAVFDRAALIALPPEMRKQYAEKMQYILNSDVETLLIALEYPDSSVNGPPFAVFQKEVEALYGGWCTVELLEKADTEVKGTPCHEMAYRLKVS